MSLPNLCDYITGSKDLEQAIIMASECYVTRSIVRHRYVLLQLHYEGQTFWIRVDRRLGRTGLMAFIFGSSTSSSRDTVRE